MSLKDFFSSTENIAYHDGENDDDDRDHFQQPLSHQTLPHPL